MCLLLFDEISTAIINRYRRLTLLHEWFLSENNHEQMELSEKVESQAQVQLICHICYYNQKKIVFEPCFHTICRYCNHKLKNNPCPICRIQIT